MDLYFSRSSKVSEQTFGADVTKQKSIGNCSTIPNILAALFSYCSSSSKLYAPILLVVLIFFNISPRSRYRRLAVKSGTARQCNKYVPGSESTMTECVNSPCTKNTQRSTKISKILIDVSIWRGMVGYYRSSSARFKVARGMHRYKYKTLADCSHLFLLLLSSRPFGWLVEQSWLVTLLNVLT